MIILDKKSTFFLLLIFFHIAISGLSTLIASSDFLSHLHNGEGLWNFSRDSTLYHKEAIIQLQYLKDSDWLGWLWSFPSHQNVKLISLSYWVSGYSIPFSYSLVNSVIWSLSVILIFKSSKLLFPIHRFFPFFTIIFFLQPSILLSSTQLLRDSIFILGVCSFIYGWTILEKCQARWQWFFYILCGFILTVLMRKYLFPVFAISSIVYLIWVVYKKRWMMMPAVLLVFLLALYNFNYINPRSVDLNIENDPNWTTQDAQKYSEHQTLLRQQGFEKGQTSTIDELFLIREELQDLIENQALLKQALIERQALGEQQTSFEQQITPMPTSVDAFYSVEEKRNLRMNELEDVNQIFIKQRLALEKKRASLTQYLTISEKKNIAIEKREKSSEKARQRQDLIEKQSFFEFTFLDNISRVIGTMRFNFSVSHAYSGSEIDFDQHISGFFDAIKYFPRAVQVGFFVPFPNDWLREGSEVGRIGMLLAGSEMILWYIILVGYFYIFFTHLSIMRPLIPVFIFSLAIIILLGYVLPNIGAIFRMRQGYMLPFYIFGLYGVLMLYEKWSQRNLP